MAGIPLPTERVMDLLVETPRRIEALTAGLTPAQLRTRPEPEEWSANEVLAHLRACGDVWGGCIATMLAEDRPTIRAVNPTTWIGSTDYPELDFRPSMDAYLTQRQALVQVLQELTVEEWGRTATVIGAGRPLERSVRFYAQWLAQHERTHLKQLARTTEVVRVR